MLFQTNCNHLLGKTVSSSTDHNMELDIHFINWISNSKKTYYNKTNLDALISQIYFWNKILHVSDSSSVHHQEFFTVHTAMVYVIQVCWLLARKLSPNLHDMYHCRVYSEKLPMMDGGTVRNMWSFSPKINLRN